MGVSENYGYPFGVPQNTDYSIFRSILGSTSFGKLPNLQVLASWDTILTSQLKCSLPRFSVGFRL